MDASIALLVDAFFSAGDTNENLFKRLSDESGILSLSETPVSEQMWGLYSDSGTGFLVEFDSSNEFFRSPKNGNNLLKPVIYVEGKAKDFWSNPYYMFLAKDVRWEFEKEWRVIKKLSECDEVLPRGIHLWNVPRGAVRSVIFGYNFECEKVEDLIAKLRRFDSRIDFKRAVLNSADLKIEINTLD